MVLTFGFTDRDLKSKIPLDSKIDTPGLGILLEAPAVCFVEQSADKITLILTDIIGLLSAGNLQMDAR